MTLALFDAGEMADAVGGGGADEPARTDTGAGPRSGDGGRDRVVLVCRVESVDDTRRAPGNRVEFVSGPRDRPG